jgi:tetratricopeptide (TPR) repeat protein
MWKSIMLLLLLCTAGPASARDKPENWLEVHSPHFTVATNANEKTGRRIADQFERMRAVFHVAFPHVSIDRGSPIIVLAIRDEKDFRELEPQVYLAKGQLKLGGLFLRAPDKNYVLMRVDAEGDHPYAVIYHEYTHFLLSKASEWMPLWLNEGLAQFYENTDIHEKDVALGQPSPGNLLLLRENRLLPLATLFTVDANSPYYHEENKGSIFYAESWALTHYIYVTDHVQKTQRLTDYAELLANQTESVTAATRAFGDLNQLQSNLERYIQQGTFSYFKLATTTEIDDTAFKVEPLTETQAEALRADFLACDGRVADAQALLDRVLQEDPKNLSAHETKGYLEFRAGHLNEARKWYQQAVMLDSQSYVAHYYFAAISMTPGAGPSDDAQVEASLRAAIKLDPSFAPAFDRLAAFEAARHRNLDDAHRMALTAVQLDPGNVGYRMTAASVLMEMDRTRDAAAVLKEASRIAKSPEESAMVQNFLVQVDQYAAARDQQAEQNHRAAEQMRVEAQDNGTAALEKDATNGENSEVIEETLPKGPHHFVTGTLQNIRCHTPAIDLAVAANGKTMALHGINYYKIAFTTLGFTPNGDLNPCSDLEGRPAKVEYIEPSAKPQAAYVVAIELHK